MKKKLLSLLLVSALAVSVTACGDSSVDPDISGNVVGESSAESSVEESTQQSSEESSEEVAEAAISMAAAIEGMEYDDASTYIYENALGDFQELYEAAKEIMDDNDQRFAQMAVAEGKFLADAVFLPIQSKGGNYAISRVAPYTITPVLWGNDSDRFHQALITTEPITTADRAEMKAKYAELKTTGTYEQWAKDFLTEKGYELVDYYNYAYNDDPQNWDALATSRAVDSEALVNTFDGLMEYDIEGVQQPALAESYEVSEDGLTYTFHLRQGVKWVDSQGREVAEVKADDFVAAMQHMCDAQGGLEWLIDGLIVNAGQYIGGEITDFSQVGVEAIDDYTVAYHLEYAAPYFTSMLGYNIFAPMSRAYYESQGGKFGAEYDPTASDYNYAKGPDSIAYCGPYLVTNATENTTIVFQANESYWNADNINIKTITWLFNDGSDTTKTYYDMQAGTLAGAGLNSSTITIAKEDGWFDQYGYISGTDATAYCGFLNLHRQMFTNFNDESAVVSPQTEEDAARTFEAMNNVHFRRAFMCSMDRGAYLACTVGEDLKYAPMINSYTPGTFVTLENEVTVDINGTATTFPAGTNYGEIVQAQLDADGIDVKVWDPAADDGAGSSAGFDGWYNPEYAVAEMEIAIAELAEIGVVVDENNPIYIDYPYPSNVEAATNRVNALKQSIEKVLGGKVIVNLIACADYQQFYDTAYYPETGSEMNYDISDASGWGPDYGDPSSYLDTILPDYVGYMTKSLGVF